ncbi:MAG: acyl-CoA thioesterase [Armatimonadetes bacterium]|nr:acyl-CoA thioesterase [Armatimonadota bacterium]
MPPRDSQVTFRFLAEPTDVNFGGKVHGGAVMKWIDQAAYACAVGWSGCYCVTVYVGGIRFYQPVFIGHVVEITARIIYTGRTSMHIAVDVGARDPKGGRHTRTTHCIIVFVAVDEAGQPVKVPAWVPETEEEKSLEQYARRLMELRQGIEEEMHPYRPPANVSE